MSRPVVFPRVAALVAALVLHVPAAAQDGDAAVPPVPPVVVPSEPPAFEPQLVRLMEILGSLEVLRDLCGNEAGEWRARAEAVIAAEGEEARLRRRMIAAYNRGNGALAAYSACTPSAVFAIDRYMREGERLTRDVLVRYGE